ncbi:MAG: 4'-phosphopantetheinyl transferase superfamily protein [Cyclobacteriaceae bacterium]|nr:4'-phosphopantetheinyl transferase superfamily protein [Cyclobacteriaceae bacterium]
MPLFKKLIEENFILAVWHLTESEEFFLVDKGKFSASPEKLDEIKVEQRRREWLCSRHLGWSIAKEIEGKCDGVWSDSYNKPHIKNSELQISISHAKPYVAVLVHKHNSCGVDIEEKKNKLIRLAPKFLTQYELGQTNSNIDALAIAWGAKEAIYKMYGRKQLIFKENIFLHKLDSIQQCGHIKSELKVNNIVTNIDIKYKQFENHVLVFTG